MHWTQILASGPALPIVATCVRGFAGSKPSASPLSGSHHAARRSSLVSWSAIRDRALKQYTFCYVPSELPG